eukprot:1458737-Amphidinium_carterae.1
MTIVVTIVLNISRSCDVLFHWSAGAASVTASNQHKAIPWRNARNVMTRIAKDHNNRHNIPRD